MAVSLSLMEKMFAFEGTESGPEAHTYYFGSTSLGRRCISRVGWQGEAYMGGYWVTSSLDQVIRFFVANITSRINGKWLNSRIPRSPCDSTLAQ